MPDHAEALLGKVRALTFAGRYQDALAAIDALLALERLVYRRRPLLARAERGAARTARRGVGRRRAGGEADHQRGGPEAGRRSSPCAGSSWPVARAKFEEAQQRNDADCEMPFYLGDACWPSSGSGQPSVEAFVSSRGLPRRSAGGPSKAADRAAPQAPGGARERQARQIARREQQLAAQARMRATSWFNTAAACFNLSRHDEAQAVTPSG